MSNWEEYKRKRREADPEGYDRMMAYAEEKFASGEWVVTIHEVPPPSVWNRLKLWFRRFV